MSIYINLYPDVYLINLPIKHYTKYGIPLKIIFQWIKKGKRKLFEVIKCKLDYNFVQIMMSIIIEVGTFKKMKLKTMQNGFQ